MSVACLGVEVFNESISTGILGSWVKGVRVGVCVKGKRGQEMGVCVWSQG